MFTLTALSISNPYQQIATESSGALFNGKVTSDVHPNTGYLIAANSSMCTALRLNQSNALTADHCMNSTQDIFFSQGEVNSQRLIPVVTSARKVNGQDLSILNLKDPEINQAQIQEETIFFTEPKKGCYYDVVAYGRNNDDNSVRRRTISGCITVIDKDTFVLEGQDNTGVCLGDSGATIFIKDSEIAVGAISSLFGSNPACDQPHTALAVRYDSLLDMIEDKTSTKVKTIENNSCYFACDQRLDNCNFIKNAVCKVKERF